jgi:hypothetical protein
MATVVSGIMNQNLPWLPIIVGGMLAIGVELLGHGALPFAIGLYLPPSLSTPIMVGGIVAWIVNKRSKPEEAEARTMRGTLFASGLVAGDSLIGVFLAFLVGGWGWYGNYFNAHADQETSLTTTFGPWLSIILYTALAIFLYRITFGGKKNKAA